MTNWMFGLKPIYSLRSRIVVLARHLYCVILKI